MLIGEFSRLLPRDGNGYSNASFQLVNAIFNCGERLQWVLTVYNGPVRSGPFPVRSRSGSGSKWFRLRFGCKNYRWQYCNKKCRLAVRKKIITISLWKTFAEYIVIHKMRNSTYVKIY
jgi:hypothetical protein